MHVNHNTTAVLLAGWTVRTVAVVAFRFLASTVRCLAKARAGNAIVRSVCLTVDYNGVLFGQTVHARAMTCFP